jgi:hypothetical protein
MATETPLAHVLMAKFCDHRVSWNTRPEGGVELRER